MRRGVCVPMIVLCLLLTACGGTGSGAEGAAEVRAQYRRMAGCTMEAQVTCAQEDRIWEAELRCTYVPEDAAEVEVLEPETIAGVRAALSDGEVQLVYEDQCLNAGTLSSQKISPMACLPQVVAALRDGWLLEENREEWEGTPCLRLTLDQTGAQDGKILTSVWLREEDCKPVRAEIAVDGKIILTAEFTSFSFYDTIDNQE